MKKKSVLLWLLVCVLVLNVSIVFADYDYVINHDDAVYSVTLDANADAHYKVYQGQGDVTYTATYGSKAGIEDIKPSGDLDPLLQSVDSVSAVNALPYERFEVPFEGESLKIRATTQTEDGEKLGAYAYNNATSKWDLIDVHMAKITDIEGSASVNFSFELSSDYNLDDKASIVIAPALVNNHSKTLFWNTDTQYYTRLITSPHEIYKIIVNYAKDLYENGDIAYVVHTGDIVNFPTFRPQYIVADEAQNILDHNFVPNGLVAGNHDVGHSPSTVHYEMFQEYFGRQRYEDKLWFGDDFENNKLSYHLVTIDDKDFIFLYLGMGVENTEETKAWANEVLERYSHRNAVIALHEYMDEKGEYVNQRAVEVYEDIAVPNDNVKMVLCGHMTGSFYRINTFDDRAPIVEMLTDYQSLKPEQQGGLGYIRLMRFENDKISATTYSPYLDDYNKFDQTPELLQYEAFEIDMKLNDSNRHLHTSNFEVIVAGETLFDSDVLAGESFSVIPSDTKGQLVVEETVGDVTKTSFIDLTQQNDVQVDRDNPAYPRQVVVHVGADACHKMNMTWTTKKPTNNLVVLTKPDGQSIQFRGKSYWHMGKYFHQVSLDNLQADMRYDYKIGDDKAYTLGTFKTTQEASADEPTSFYYIADPQVAVNEDAEAAGAVFQLIADQNPDMVYMAGDITENAIIENQWEILFNNKGLYADGGENLMKSTAISTVVGNHDFDTFSEHIEIPNEKMPGVYAFDQGVVKFIMLNTNYFDPISLARQEKFLREEVSNAKKNGQWVAVGFHKSLYSGASHMDDIDVSAVRNAWAPVFADIDVDVVLAGHDHIYSRTFVNRFGEHVEQEDTNYMKNVPLYMTGGHAGGLKWYSLLDYNKVDEKMIKDYNENYLDVVSVDASGEKLKNQTYIKVTANKNEMHFTTYMFKYDETSDQIDLEPFVYDEVVLTK